MKGLTAPCLLAYVAHIAPGKGFALSMKVYRATTIIVDMLLECVAATELLVYRLTQLYFIVLHF